MASPLANLVVPDLSAPTTVHVNVANFSFSTNVTIHIGDTVEWDWVSGTHTVTSVAGSADPFNSGVKSSGDFTHVFDVAGTFNYFCSIHGFDNGDGTAGGMSATVTVLPVPEPATVGLAGMGLAGLLMGRRVRKA
jgi:plastocyanin